MLKKFTSDKINCTKMPSFFFNNLQLIMVLLLIFASYTSWSTRFVSKAVCGLFHFRFHFILISLYFCSAKCMDSLTLKRNSFKTIPFKIKIKEKPHTVLLRDLWFLSCNKKFWNSVTATWVGAPQKLTRWQIFKPTISKFWQRLNSTFSVNIRHSFT